MVTVPKDDYNRTNGKPLVQLTQLDPKRRKQVLGPEIGTAFDAYTRLFASFGQGDVFEVGEWKARDIDLMLRRDGDAMMVEQALTLPVRSTTYSLTPRKGDTGEADFITEQLFQPPEAGGFHPGMDVIVAQMAEACAYRKAFFEKHYVFDGNQVTMDSLEWRPPSTCDIRRDEHTARFDGFRQRAWWYSTQPGKQAGQEKSGLGGKNFTGFLDIPKIRSFVLIHGLNRNPLVGTSDLEVTYWAYKQKQKMLFLWYQYLETQSLPKLAVYGSDQDQADAAAETISTMKASATGGFMRPPPGQSLFDVIESSGKGADQFSAALQYLSAYQTSSCMAGFLALGSAASLGRGSYALAESSSQFFLQSRQAFVKEITNEFTRQVIMPLCVLNKWGADAAVPKLTAAPLTEADAQMIVTALTSMAVAPSLTVPHEYVLLLAEKAAEVFNLPTDKVTDLLTSSAALSAAKAQDKSVVGQGAAQIAGATQAAGKLAGSISQQGTGRPVGGSYS